MRMFRAIFELSSRREELEIQYVSSGVSAKKTNWLTWEFSLDDTVISAIMADYTPSGLAHPDAVDALENYIATSSFSYPGRFVRVEEITEPKATTQPTGIRKPSLRNVPDHGENCSCPIHRPGNPGLSDPWARGY